MNGLDVHENMIANGIIHTKAIQIGLRSHLPEFYEQLSGIITNCFDENFNTAKAPGQEWVHLSIFSVAKNIITATNAFVFFGPQLASNPVFLKAARDYPEDLFFMAETLRLVPSLLHPCLTPILKRYQRGLKIMVEHITPSVEERLHQERIPSPYRKANREKPRDCIQFFIDSNSREGEWTADKIVQVLLGVWFAGVHQPAMSIAYVLEDLSQNPQYVELLRDELSSTYQDTKDIETKVNTASLIENRPFLDAFLKESSRLRPSDSISVRRKVLEPFTFQDGTHLLAGDVVCLPSQAIMLDDEIYPDSTKFWPWRFLRADSEDISPKRLRCTSRFTTADSTYPRWSLGRHSW
ncbi:hypothetical protein RRF57_005706 [Xylaria bambusicola]|uniref:Cytochrome P450 n=1 Tax=Xylaria bambusicola TaxID=326684 RepID=A0AAN7Z9F4_9PEZI